MLKELRIKNFVLIDALTLSFGAGICLLTGETGAGKSILIDALEAALGGRVSLDVIRTGTERAVIEATFHLPAVPRDLAALLDEEGIALALPDEVTLSRELSPKGTRCRIEGQVVTLAALRRAGTALVDILSQHEHHALMEPPFHLTLLDTFGHLLGLRDAVSRAYGAWAHLHKERTALVEGAANRAQQRDFWAFQLNEIESAALDDPQEDAALKAERLRLVNAEQLRNTGAAAYDALYAGESAPSLYDRLNQVIASLKSASNLDEAFASASEQLGSALETMRDVASELRDHAEGLEAEPDRLAEVEDRLDLLSKLSRKYGPGLDAVMAFGEQLKGQLSDVESADERLEELDAALEKAAAELGALSAKLSAERAEQARRLEAAVEGQLKELMLPDARFEVALMPHRTEPAFRASGHESAEFQISLNAGEAPRPLAKVASGGEMARVMLGLKTVLAGLSDIPTLVFDEVDTGISGKAAQAVAEKLANLGRTYQILCITHLPTVAAMADTHVHLEKHVREGRTYVTASLLDAHERACELARLASGSSQPAALQHAEELLSRAAALKARR